MIQSLQNDKVKRVMRLQDKRGRQRFGQFVVEGAREIGRALASGFQLDYLLVHKPLAVSSEAHDVLVRVSPEQVDDVAAPPFQKMAVREQRDGLIAVFRTRSMTLAELTHPAPGFYVVLDQVEKPGNLGAVLRSVDGAGLDGIILLGSSVETWNPNVIRSSVGTVFSLPVVTATDEEFADFLASHPDLPSWAVSPEAEQTYFTTDLTAKSGLMLFGSEAHGLRPQWKARVSSQLAIPMRGLADSLNLSVSVALLAYERLRQLAS
jgi:TrmH family RNA methyltransferase